MNAIIIEDEAQTAWDIRHCLKSIRPSLEIVMVLDSVEASVEWLSQNKSPDLIFSDIQLGDGLAFEIFRKVTISCPVIFCTAYDQYAIEAFENNGVDYVLKPVNEKSLEKSLRKIETLGKVFGTLSLNRLESLFYSLGSGNSVFKNTFLVHYRSQLIPIAVDDIAFFKVDRTETELWTLQGKNYQLTESLEHLESSVDPKLFYRANRQYLISRKAIRQIEHIEDRKLSVSLTTDSISVIVSKAKAADFLRWIESF